MSVLSELCKIMLSTFKITHYYGASCRIDLLSTLCVYLQAQANSCVHRYTIPMFRVILENALYIDFVFDSTTSKTFYIFYLDVWQSVTTHKLCFYIIYGKDMKVQYVYKILNGLHINSNDTIIFVLCSAHLLYRYLITDTARKKWLTCRMKKVKC